MKKFFLLSAVMSLFIFSVRSETSPVLASPEWLKENMKDPKLVILQVSFLRLDFEKEHISGSRLLWPDWLTFSSPEGSYNPPEPKEATKVLQEKLGLNKDSRVIISYYKNDISIAARMFVTLEYLGLQGKISMLNGGLDAWKNAGYPVEKGSVQIKKGNYTAKIIPVIVDKEYVLSSLKSENAVVIDARPKRFYEGEPTSYPRFGHIAGAKNIQYADMFDSTGTFKTDAEMMSYFLPVVQDKNKEIVDYCFIGQTACVLFVAGRQLGYKIKLYDGSMQEWSRYEELPMEKVKKE